MTTNNNIRLAYRFEAKAREYQDKALELFHNNKPRNEVERMVNTALRFELAYKRLYNNYYNL